MRPIGVLQRMGAVLAAAMVLLWSGAIQADDRPQAANDADAVMQYLDRSIDWYRRIVVLNSTPVDPRELVLRDNLVAGAKNALARAFIFAKADAALIASRQTAPATTSASAAEMNKSATAALTKVSLQIADLQNQLTAFQNSIAANPAAADHRVLAQRDKLASELNLALARQQVLQTFTSFMQSTGGDLTSKINDLQQSVPEIGPIVAQQLAQQQPTPNAPTDQPSNNAGNGQSESDQGSDDGASASGSASAPALQSESDGIVGLVTDMFTLSSRLQTLSEIKAATASLSEATDQLRIPLRNELIQAMQKGEKLSTSRPSEDIAALGHDKDQLDTLTSLYKYLAATAVPLGEQKIALDDLVNDLDAWRATLELEYAHVLQSLGIRIGVAGAIILLLVGVSELWRRAAFRYIGDARRRRQFLVLRRFVVGSIIVLVVIASFVTELSSLATFAGIITAGVAVALQSIILSGVAYFFIIGKYGVRVGDRVTINGVTGDVMDIGLFRLYLMEIGGPALDLHPTGRIVVFSNAILFQPSAFFKNIPGAEYVWHEIAMTLSPDADFKMVKDRLMAAIDEVFNGYKDDVLRQYNAVKDTIHLTIPDPKPQARLRFVDSGVELAVRYPVETDRENEIDSQMTQALLSTIEKDPSLKMVATSTPKLQAADDRK